MAETPRSTIVIPRAQSAYCRASANRDAGRRAPSAMRGICGRRRSEIPQSAAWRPFMLDDDFMTEDEIAFRAAINVL